MKQVNKNLVLLVLLFSYTCCPALDLPRSFGKTNFIVGVDSQTLIKEAGCIHKCNCLEDILRPTQIGIRKVFFAPDDNVLEILLQLIRREKSSIRMAAFLLTEYNIVKAIFEARSRGVSVTIIFDPKTIKSRYANLVRSLVARGVEIYVYNPAANTAAHNASDKLSNIMHNKFIIFGDNIFERSLVWTGSFNFTYSAHKVNQENVVILDDKDIVKRYSDRFDHLKEKLCDVYTPEPRNHGRKRVNRRGAKA